METLKNTQTITFTKSVTIAPFSTKAIVTIEHGTNKRGKIMRVVNQVNTANSVIDDARDEFESGITSLENMISVIESQGFQKATN